MSISGLRAPQGTGTSFRLFLNCDYLSVATPIDDPHYVSSASFFTAGDGEHDHGGHHLPTFKFDITDTLNDLRGRGMILDEVLKPQLVAIDTDGRASVVVLDGSIDVEIQGF